MNDWIEIAGAAIGIVYLILEYRANVWLWLFGVLMPLFYIVIFFREGIFANGCINVYYVAISLYGAVCWLKRGRLAEGKDLEAAGTSSGSTEGTSGGAVSSVSEGIDSGAAVLEGDASSAASSTRIGSMPRSYWGWTAAAVAALSALLWWVLSALGESEVAALDGFTSALSIVAMWMLAKGYYQQWICWIVVEPVMVAMSLRAGLFPTAVMYGVYSVIAVMGFLRWRKEWQRGL